MGKKHNHPAWMNTVYGVMWGDLFTIVRIACNHEGDSRRWAAIEVRTKDGSTIQITATPRTTIVVHKKAGTK